MSQGTDVVAWLKKNLEGLLPFVVSTTMAQCIMRIENDRDLVEYFSMHVDTSSAEFKKFFAAYKKVRFCKDGKKSEHFVRPRDGESKCKKVAAENATKGKETNCQSNVAKDKAENVGDQKRKKTKFVNLYSPEGMQKDVILLKGRHACECQATKHRLINNCLKCGRIVCEQERSGPCLFCGTMVFSRGERSLLNSDSKQSRELYEALKDAKKMEELNKALEKRDKLLDFDKEVAQRTKVIDDEAEYYNANSAWLSKEERERLAKMEEEAHAKRHASRLDKKLKYDFIGHKVVEDEAFMEAFQNAVISKLDSMSVNCSNPDVPVVLHPLYETRDGVDATGRKAAEQVNSAEGNPFVSRIQDKELLEMWDKGICLSVHQPWASLLVCGIMRYEGRTWYTSHRGRLWIASTSKNPQDAEIREAENFFKRVRFDEELAFPTFYPTSSLLGCVSLAECLPQEDFLAKYPDGECDSPFVFVCEDPQRLNVFFPITGSHKMYQLDSKIHVAACKTLLRKGQS